MVYEIFSFFFVWELFVNECGKISQSKNLWQHLINCLSACIPYFDTFSNLLQLTVFLLVFPHTLNKPSWHKENQVFAPENFITLKVRHFWNHIHCFVGSNIFNEEQIFRQLPGGYNDVMMIYMMIRMLCWCSCKDTMTSEVTVVELIWTATYF